MSKPSRSPYSTKSPEAGLTLEQIPYITLEEFGKRNIALETSSGILGCHIWLCSNEEMAAQMKKDDPEGVCYVVDELRELIRLNPSPEDLKRIHDAKSVFEGAKVKESKLIEDSNEGH